MRADAVRQIPAAVYINAKYAYSAAYLLSHSLLSQRSIDRTLYEYF